MAIVGAGSALLPGVEWLNGYAGKRGQGQSRVLIVALNRLETTVQQGAAGI